MVLHPSNCYTHKTKHTLGVDNVVFLSEERGGVEFSLCGAVVRHVVSLVSALRCARPTVQQVPASLLPSAFLFFCVSVFYWISSILSYPHLLCLAHSTARDTQ